MEGDNESSHKSLCMVISCCFSVNGHYDFIENRVG